MSEVISDELLSRIVSDCICDSRVVCEAACPLEVPIREIMRKVRDGNLGSAWRTYEKTVVFARIVSRICGEKCTAGCPMKVYQGAPNIQRIEAALCEMYSNEGKRKTRINKKNKNVLVVGGGLTGLSCAVRLAMHGYPVKLYESSGVLCGRLRASGLIPEGVLEAELKEVVYSQKYLEIVTDTEISDLSTLQFDAAFIAVGDGIVPQDAERFSCVVTAQRSNDEFIYSVASGFEYAHIIEEYFQINKIRMPKSSDTRYFEPTLMKCDIKPPIIPVGEYYSSEELRSEASRCELCQCSACSDVCDVLSYFKKTPKQAAIDAGTILHDTVITHKQGVRLMSACSQCGACESVCQEGLNVKELFIRTRRYMTEKGILAPVFSEFWLNDMLFSIDEASFLIPGSEYLFFPGCQLGASDPDYVYRAYELLKKTLPESGLYQSCCGMPAEWACREEFISEAILRITDVWKNSGCPVFVLACPSCKNFFDRHIQEIKTTFIWEVLPAKAHFNGGRLCVFDPCAAERMPETKALIREIVHVADFETEELPFSGRCCGYGGFPRAGNEGLYEYTVQKNIAGNELPYLTYCANCRDVFAAHEKPALHVLDILCFENVDERYRAAPNLSQRRENRRELKHQMTGIRTKTDELRRRLIFPDEVIRTMERQLLLEETVTKAIENAEKSKTFFIDDESETRICSLKEGYVTVWVRYAPHENDFEICDVYSHRVQILEEII